MKLRQVLQDSLKILNTDNISKIKNYKFRQRYLLGYNLKSEVLVTSNVHSDELHTIQATKLLTFYKYHLTLFWKTKYLYMRTHHFLEELSQNSLAPFHFWDASSHLFQAARRHLSLVLSVNSQPSSESCCDRITNWCHRCNNCWAKSLVFFPWVQMDIHWLTTWRR